MLRTGELVRIREDRPVSRHADMHGWLWTVVSQGWLLVRIRSLATGVEQQCALASLDRV